MSKRTKPAGQQLRDAIADAERRGVTRYRLEKLSEIHRATIARIAEGERGATLDTAARLAEACGYELVIRRRR